ncbi:MAG TPA: ABC transporter ATP-binding protein [Saprospiraceae bacterium]|nr:ABC transporter ATP-binding protein [Saprospiraceae bacterium]HHH54776.1 ABC transporter ATP-binding protein [Bacteroidota bacterium]
MTESTVISVENLTKLYGNSIGVSNINFSVNSGEIFGFLGPNGAGKTTTIRIMLDLLRPTSGMIKIFGKKVQNDSIHIRSLTGYLPGNFSTFTGMTGNEFLRFVSLQRKLSFLRPQRLYERFELTSGDLSKKLSQLSQGMLQKLGIIQAVMHNPKLLILDEPTNGLDPLMQEEFYHLLLEMQGKGCTIFFSSHNLSEVEKICHRIGVIRNGEIVALETLQNLKKKRYRKLKLTLGKPISGLTIKNADIISKNGSVYEFLIKGDTKNLINELNNLPVEDFIFPEPSLDEVFRAYYKDKDHE